MNDKGNFGVIAWPLLPGVKINIALYFQDRSIILLKFNLFKSDYK
jgi:hypothetical protein